MTRLAISIKTEDDFKDIKVTRDMVLIPRTFFNELVTDANKLDALEAGGVDNWEGYSEALRGFYSEEEDDDDA